MRGRDGRDVRRRDDWSVRFGETHPINKGPEFGLGEFLQPVEVGKLRIRSGLGFVKPVAPIRLPVYANWSADCIAKLSIFEPVLAWEYLDPFLEPATLDRDAESESEIVDVDAALRGQQWLGAEDPEMPAAARLFQGGIHSVLLQLPLQLKQ